MHYPRHKVISTTNEAGISLIEVMVAVLLISFSLLGLMSLQARAFQFSVDSEDSTRAALLASELASTMVMANTTTLPNTVIEAWQARIANATAAGLPRGTGEVVATSATTARITIQWLPPKAVAGAENRYQTDVTVPFIPAPPASSP